MAQATVLDLSTTPTNILCNGASTGAVDLSVSGGTPPYTYVWSSGETTQDISGKAAGNYIVTVTDDNGCTASTNRTLTESALVGGSSVITSTTCNGDSDGAVDFTPSGGNGPYTYVWSSGETTQDISGKAAGGFTVTITDANSCTGTHAPTVTQPAVVSANPVVTNTTCPYSTNGAIDLTPSGGTSPYTFVWSTGSTTEDISGRPTGTYAVTVTDANSCTGSSTGISIASNSNITSSFTITDVTVHAGSDGEILNTVGGGIAPYSYAWSNGAGTKNIAGLTAGIYTVTITDNTGCTITQTGEVIEPGACPCAWLGITDNDWRTITNWDCGFEPTDTCDVLIPAGTTYTCNVQSTAACRDLTINASATLIISGANQLDIHGDFSNSGTFTRNTSTVRFMGAAEQGIAGSTQTSFYNLHISNSSATGVVMSRSFRVYNEIRLLDGYVFTGTDTVKVEAGTSTSLSVFSANSFVVGKIRRRINGAGHFPYEFPVGDAGTTTRYFRACIKTHNLAGTNYLTVWFDTLRNHADGNLQSAFLDPQEDISTYYNYNVPKVVINGGDTTTTTDYSGSGYTNAANYMQQNFNLQKVYEDDGIYYTGIAREGEWQFEPDVQPTGGFYDMQIYITNIAYLSDNNFGVLKRPTGSTGWHWSGGGGKMNPFNGEGRLVAHGYALRKMLTTFSGGGAGGGGGGGLPIELLDFKAELVQDDVELTWVTATEINNDYFTLEKSDGVNFRQIAIIPGAGNSSETKYYSKIDYEPFIGTSYYRLKQTDFDGRFTYSDVVSVTYKPENPENEDNELVVYPNPSGGNFSVVIKNASEKVTLNLFDNRGKLVMTESYAAHQDNYIHQVKIEGIPSGVYYLKAEMDEKTRYTKKLMLFNEK